MCQASIPRDSYLTLGDLPPLMLESQIYSLIDDLHDLEMYTHEIRTKSELLYYLCMKLLKAFRKFATRQDLHDIPNLPTLMYDWALVLANIAKAIQSKILEPLIWGDLWISGQTDQFQDNVNDGIERCSFIIDYIKSALYSVSKYV